MVAAISDPRSPLSSEKSRGHAPSSNIMFSLQQDTGKWCSEYTWSAEDGMWGVRTLYNFGKLGNHVDAPAVAEDGDKFASNAPSRSKPKRVDEEDAMEGGLRGRISVGAEFYLSAKEKSAGGVFHAYYGPVRDAQPCCTSCSVYRSSIHNVPGRDASVVSDPFFYASRRSSPTGARSRTTLTAAYHHHRAL